MKCVVFFFCLAVATAFALRPLLTESSQNENDFIRNQVDEAFLVRDPTAQHALIRQLFQTLEWHYRKQLAASRKELAAVRDEEKVLRNRTALLEKEVSFVLTRTMIEILEKRLLKGIPSERPAEYKSLPEKVYQWKYVLDRENKTFPIVTSDDFRIILESLKNRTTHPKTFVDFGTCMKEEYQELCEDMQSRMFSRLRGLPYDFSVPVKKSCSPVVSIIDDIFAIENVQLFKRKVSV